MQHGHQRARLGWVYAGLVVLLLTVFIAVMAWWPAAFAVRLFGTSYFTVGALFGIFVITAPVALTALHGRTRGPGDSARG